MLEDAGQCGHSLREVFNGLGYGVRTGAAWHWMLNDLPPRAALRQQAPRRLEAGCFGALANDLREVRRLGCQPQGRAVCRHPRPPHAALHA